jgi:hypothetical protein
LAAATFLVLIEMITCREQQRKRDARRRAAAERQQRVQEAADMIAQALGDDLPAFVELFNGIDPLKLRARLGELAAAIPAEQPPPIDEAKLAQMRAEWRSRPHPSGFHLRYVGDD